MKKASALLIVLLIIATLGAFVLTVVRSVVSGVGFTSSLSDAMIAEQASQAGLEYGLLQYKNNPDYTTSTIRLDLETNILVPLTTLLPDHRYADITISGTSNNKIIESIGHFSGISKKHTLRSGITSFVLRPDGDASPLTWSPSSGTEHYSLINEEEVDDSTYVYSSGIADPTDVYDFTTAPGINNIRMIEVRFRARRGGIEPGPSPSLRIIIRMGSSSFGLSQEGFTLEYKDYKKVFVPPDSSSWGQHELNDLQVGIIRLADRFTGNIPIMISQLYVVVWYMV